MNIRRALQVVVFVASAAYLASTAVGDIIPVGPFTGDVTESWESFPEPSGEEDYLPDPSVIMDGAATISNPFMWIYTSTSGFGLGSSGAAQVADGEKAMGLSHANQTATIIFAEPVLSFGAYWAAFTGFGMGDPATITVGFFDESDDLIGIEAFEYSRSEQGDGLLEWHGWSSSTPIKSLTYTEDGVAIDALQADVVPEPAAHVLLGFAGLMFLHSRQRLCRRGRLFCRDRTRGKRTMQVLAFVSVLTVVCSAASGEIIPIEPFTGDLTETWESFPLPKGEDDYLPSPMDIMGGAAAISSAHMRIYSINSDPRWSLGTSGPAGVSDGVKGMGLAGFAQSATILFNDSVLNFGAYWGAFTHPIYGGDPAFVNVSFFDEFDDLIGVQVFEYSRSEQGDGLLEWHGWSSSTPITRIVYSEDFVVTDGLQADPIPEPITLSLLAIGVLVFLRSNRR